MSEVLDRPSALQVNAWTVAQSNRQDLPAKTPWAQRRPVVPGGKLAPAPTVDARDWSHPAVGWGLVLADGAGLTAQESSAGDDAPEAIQRLLRSRPGSPVLRWSARLRNDFLRRYYPDGRVQDLSVAASPAGTADGCIPRYLLIYATPRDIPWAVQYALNPSRYVGRLDLGGPELDNYVDALVSDWKDHACRPEAPLFWSVDLGQDDITWLMARAVGGRLLREFENDADFGDRHRLGGDAATCGNLAAALAAATPGLIVTTSHGMTGPLGQPALVEQLGLPVDAGGSLLRPQDLAMWAPSGAIWYAHACCSAGSDAVSSYAGLLPADGPIGSILAGIAATAGAMVAPLPRALLGRTAPLRAFVGHVEPTFDWTLRDTSTKQVMTSSLVQALYNDLFQADRRTPIGFALRRVYAEAGQYLAVLNTAIDDIDANKAGARDRALYNRLVATDRQTMVIIGDPTVALPTNRSAPKTGAGTT